MNALDDLKKRIEFYEKHHLYIFFGKEERGFLSTFFSPIGIMIVVVVGFILLFLAGISVAWWFFALALILFTVKAEHKEGYKDGYEDGWEDGWNRAKGKQTSLEYNERNE